MRIRLPDERCWFPVGARHVYGCPEVGDVVALDHQAWTVIELHPLPREQWVEQEQMYACGGIHTPMAVRLRPMELVNHPDPVKARSKDRHVGSLRVFYWYVFPDPEHYPVCACCAEPMPCRAEVGRRMAQDAVKDMGRYETAGICPACGEPVTARQKSLTFSENLVVPFGPPVTFHTRRRCHHQAMTYEQRWAAADPQRRRHTLSCPGRLTNHNDGTYDCSELGDCPGPAAQHTSYTMCRCPDCWARPWVWGRGCHPAPNARLNGRDEGVAS